MILERMRRFELLLSAWKADVLAVKHYTRLLVSEFFRDRFELLGHSNMSVIRRVGHPVATSKLLESKLLYGWYFIGDSARTGVLVSTSPTYTTQY